MADSGGLRVSRILVKKASRDNVLQVFGNKARKNCQIVPALPFLGDVSDIFYFFLLGGGEGEARGAGKGGSVLIEYPRRGGGWTR